jgi:hypothetical protein
LDKQIVESDNLKRTHLDHLLELAIAEHGVAIHVVRVENQLQMIAIAGIKFDGVKERHSGLVAHRLVLRLLFCTHG